MVPSNTEEGEQVPVIAVVSPYFDYGSPEANRHQRIGAGRGEFIYDNFVPHGYALAQLAVFATEELRCFDYRGDGEGLGIHMAVEWLELKLEQWPCRHLCQILRRRNCLERRCTRQPVSENHRSHIRYNCSWTTPLQER